MNNKINEVKRIINLIDANKSIIIYGAGEHTYKLFLNTNIATKKIIGLVDKHIKMSANQMFPNYAIYNPEVILELNPDVVIISSFNYQEEIRAYLINDLNYSGEVIVFYQNSDLHPFYQSTNGSKSNSVTCHNGKVIKTINYQVNNYCNSKCVMCNVWRKKDFSYLSVNQFKTVLRDSLFKYVEHVGITGGEPTLVPNLTEYFKAVIDVLPSLKSLSLITNGIMYDKTKADVQVIQKLCDESEKKFSLMLSLDGTNEVHDRNRGIPGNFKKIEKLIRFFKKEGIEFITGTTITKNNVWNLDELLSYLHRNYIYGRFRIAEFIDRLYNNCEDTKQYIRNFTEEEIYQLQLFFCKLEFTFEHNSVIKNTYRNIRHMLEGNERIIDCPYKNCEAVNLDCHGNLSYCAPKSPIIGNLLEKSGLEIYESNLSILENIKKEHCPFCIHDYHSNLLPEFEKNIEQEKEYRSLIKTDQYILKKDIVRAEFNINKTDCKRYNYFIIGWYGTETVGDKAILGGIVNFYHKNHEGDISIAISSLYPFITKRTIKELNINADVIPVYSNLFYQCAANADNIVVGGGPLMELEELALIEWAFYFGKLNYKRTSIFGCGIGPLYSDEKINALKEILTLSDEILLRDNKSVEFANKLVGRRSNIRKIEDPAVGYIRNLNANHIHIRKCNKQMMACFLRELTYEYRTNMNGSDFISFKTRFEESLARNIKYLCKKTNMKPFLYSMHNYVLGNDDRDFNYFFASKYFPDIEIIIENKLSTIENVIEAMNHSQFNLCMRYHSVIFANTLQSNFVAIDYTNGGKIKSYLEDENKMDRLLTMAEIISREEYLYECYKKIQ